MAQVDKITKRGATVMVLAHGEAVFGPTTDFGRWQNRMRRRIESLAGFYAPSNKRTRWAHYGPRLKDTMTGDVTYRRTKGGGRAYTAVGSRSGHATFVDQGTGIHAGRAPFDIKVLPPWHVGSPSLYEASWRPGPGKRPLGTMKNPGQEGQFFMDKALVTGLTRGGIRTVKGDSQSLVKTMFPETLFTTLLGLPEGPAVSPGFIADLNMWRSWRDAAWAKHLPLGEKGALTRQVMRRLEEKRRHAENLERRKSIRAAFRDADRRAKRARKASEKEKDAKDLTKAKPKRDPLASARRASLQYMVKWQEYEAAQSRKAGRMPRHIDSPPKGWGFWVKAANGERTKVFWPMYIADRWAEGGYQN